jgi:Protein of unknown function (DUF4054)
MTVYDDTLFRTQFPEFADDVKYPPALISAYWDMASLFIDNVDFPCRMLSGGQLALSLNYMTAHLMVMGMRASGAATPDANTGGIETGASIDKISITQMAPPVKGMWDYWLAQTPYGQALLALLSIVSVGGMSVGGIAEREGFRKAGGVFW